ncbi:MAG: putative 4-hydroxybenzoate polyprenyltransferase [Planctomycetales bacterium]|nr:putative 4-hydroxybenzoate polyprenyltransferase [Planctomycetales bacterium]
MTPANSAHTDRPKGALRRILEMIRFSHTLFALPFALLAAAMAWTAPLSTGARVEFRWQDLLGILICMVTARSAAMAFNRLVDRRIDAGNPRTANRHLVTGELGVAAVTWFTIGCSAAFVAATALFLPNRLPLWLSAPVLLFLCGYSYTKRFTSLAHYWLGAALMLSPVCAWIAIRGAEVQRHLGDLTPPALLGLAVMLWVAGFDIIYACQDQAFDAERRLKSVPSRLGVAGALRVAALSHAGMVAVLACLPQAAPQLGFGWVYGAGIVAVALLLLYEHALVRSDDLTRVNTAFAHVNMVISMGLLAIGLADLWWT